MPFLEDIHLDRMCRARGIVHMLVVGNDDEVGAFENLRERMNDGGFEVGEFCRNGDRKAMMDVLYKKAFAQQTLSKVKKTNLIGE
jgi:hypothetical protein